MNPMDRINALAAKAVEKGTDMTVATTGGGGDYVPPAAGSTKLRFVAYIETGKQQDNMKGKPERFRPYASLVFELSGPKHPPHVSEDGTKTPIRITVELPISLNDKSDFYKLFNRMNYAGKAKHIAQLLGEGFKGEVIHRKYKKRDDPAEPASWTGIAVELKHKEKGFTIEPPRFQPKDEEGNDDGPMKVIPIDPAITPIKCFLWDFAEKEDWDSLYIDGQYDERKDKDGKVVAPAKSKNVWQNAIRKAHNFKGSPIYQMLMENGASLDVPDAEDGRDPDDARQDDDDAPAVAPVVLKGAAATDALNGVA